MGMSMGAGSGGRGRRRGGKKHRPMSEINMTPMVDVMLVLLIIFMVAAPLMTVGVPLELPKTQAKALSAKTQPLTISVQADGHVFLSKDEVALEDLVPKLQEIAKTGYNERVFVRAAGTAGYGTVAKVLATLQTAGFLNIGLVTDQDVTS